MPYRGAATLHDLLDAAYPRANSSPPEGAEVIGKVAWEGVQSRDPMPEPEAVSTPLTQGSFSQGVRRLALELAQGLAFLHRRQIVHRDLKPSNILLTPSGRPLLLDFNLAADARRAAPRLGGTLPYMAPEQLQALAAPDADTSAIGPRSDLFSLGVILYELLTGRQPFGPVPVGGIPEEQAPGLLERQRSGIVPLRKLNPRCDPVLATVVERCLSFDLEKRPRGADEVVRALRPPRPWVSRTTWTWAAAMLAMVLGAAWMGKFLLAPTEKDQGLELLREGDAATNKMDADRAYVKASNQLDLAEKKAQDAETAALYAYALARQRNHDAAIRWWDVAESRGMRTAELYSNRAYSLMQVAETKAGYWERASRDLEKALELDPNLPAARYNKAMLNLRASKDLSKERLKAVARLVSEAPPVPQLSADAAVLYARAAKASRVPAERAEFQQEARVLAEKAIVLGYAPHFLDLEPFKCVPGIEDIRKTQRGPAPGILAPGLVLPASAHAD
jgi:hypothetical protein